MTTTPPDTGSGPAAAAVAATDDEIIVVATAAASAPPVQVWDVLVHRTADWWASPYLAPNDGGMTLEPELGGTVRSGAGDLHGTIRAFEPPTRLVIGGVLVPGAYSGSITFTIAKTNLGSEITVAQSVRGRIEASVEERISHGWTQLAFRLAELADR